MSSNGGAAGVDGMTFDEIETAGRERWLEERQEELRAGTYRPWPLLRVWIPKSNGGQRPLGIPCIRDRVVEMAVLLVMGPIFEPDLLRQQYRVPSGDGRQDGDSPSVLAHHGEETARGGRR